MDDYNKNLIKKYLSIDKWDNAFKELENGKPIQYIIGNVQFVNSIIDVDERVLIPRFETEYLVEKVINVAKERFNEPFKIMDLATGSGCIAIALKKEFNTSSVDAIDISKDALDVAKNNAKKNNVDINFYKQDLTHEINNYDVIVSNPPYIGKDDYVEDIVINNEPSIALFADEDGLYYVKQIILKHSNKLNKNGFLAIEIGDNQEKEIRKFLEEIKFNKKYEFYKDLTGRIRYIFIYN